MVTNAPSPKTTIRARFWVTGSFDFHNTCCGSAMMSMSVAMENPAFAYQFLVRLIQVPGMDLSQARGMGLHCQIDDAVVATMYAKMIPRRMKHSTRKYCWTKMRR